MPQTIWPHWLYCQRLYRCLLLMTLEQFTGRLERACGMAAPCRRDCHSIEAKSTADPSIHVRSNIACNRLLLLVRQRQLQKLCPRVDWRQSAASRSVRTEKDTLNTDLANPLHNPVRLVSPLAVTGNTRDVKINVPYSRISVRDCFDKHRQRLISGRLVVSAGARQVCDLYGYVGGRRQEFIQERLRLLPPVWPLFRDRRPHVNDNGHASVVGRAKHTTQSLYVFSIVQINIRIAKMQFETCTEKRIGGASIQFGESVIF